MLVPAAGYIPGAKPAQVTAPPCEPTRLYVAAREVESFIKVLEQHNADRVALVMFARYAYPAIPVLTDDYYLFKRRFRKEMLLENVLTMTEGSNHWDAVERALPIFDPEDPYKKIIIIITDGDPDAPEEIIKQSRKKALKDKARFDSIEVFVVGVGEPDIRYPVARQWRADGCPDEEKGYIVQTDGVDSGRIMTTVTNRYALGALAKDLGGEFVHSTSGSELAEKLKEIIGKERVKVGERYKTSYADMSEHLLIGLLALMAAIVIIKTP
jgi:hypothetical protein